MQITWSAGKHQWPSHSWFLVLNVIDWEGGTSFVDQSRNETSAKLDYIEPALFSCKTSQNLNNNNNK